MGTQRLHSRLERLEAEAPPDSLEQMTDEELALRIWKIESELGRYSGSFTEFQKLLTIEFLEELAQRQITQEANS